MFKYLLLKAIFNISDVDLVERSKYDMSFKYFLGMAPEDDVIDSSSHKIPQTSSSRRKFIRYAHWINS